MIATLGAMTGQFMAHARITVSSELSQITSGVNLLKNNEIPIINAVVWSFVEKTAFAETEARRKAYNRIDKLFRKRELNRSVCIKEVDKEMLFGLG